MHLPTSISWSDTLPTSYKRADIRFFFFFFSYRALMSSCARAKARKPKASLCNRQCSGDLPYRQMGSGDTVAAWRFALRGGHVRRASWHWSRAILRGTEHDTQKNPCPGPTRPCDTRKTVAVCAYISGGGVVYRTPVHAHVFSEMRWSSNAESVSHRLLLHTPFEKTHRFCKRAHARRNDVHVCCI